MYKKQLIFQKFVCMLALCAAAIVFIYSLGLMTDLYDSLYSTMMNPNDLTQTDVPGSIIYYDMQGFNNTLLRVSIGLILAACLLFITNTHIRRIYYVGNYFFTCLMVAANVAAAWWAHGHLEAFKAQFLQVDFAALKEFSEMWNTAYTESTFWFDAHYAVFGLTLFASLLLVVNVIWKISVVSAEHRLLQSDGPANRAKTEAAAAERDRMRFNKNKLSANLTYIAILANVCYFINIYNSDVGAWYYRILIGASIVYNLIFMLAAFLSSEGIKNYNIRYAWLLVLLGLGQILRIFILPMQAHNSTVTIQDQAVTIMGDGQFLRVVIYLGISALCCLIAAIAGIRRSRALSAHLASLEAKTA